MEAKSTPIPESDLILLLKRKDAAAYSLLYDNYSASLYGVITRVVAAEEIAQDILQEVFIKIWKNIDSYDSSKGRLFTWMLNIARNASIDYSRSRQSKVESKIQDIDNSVYEINSRTSTRINTDVIGVKEEVAKLKDDYRVLIDMIYFGGYTQEETAKELNIPLGTVKTRVRAAIIKLRATLK
ncbi:MAG: sigma-70 family RNA polymerase sigma factor [Bacteroidota bacterium]|nr:sigma-70 family RNA polymerase sigma factor [Bacteroidota bacterium]